MRQPLTAPDVYQVRMAFRDVSLTACSAPHPVDTSNAAAVAAEARTQTRPQPQLHDSAYDALTGAQWFRRSRV